jgi:threonine dehydrogenase-like Zn-dependent dehydrogenase
MQKGLTMKTGQTHVQRYVRPLLAAIAEGKIDTTFLISHRAPLEQAAEMYRHWHDDQNEYTKIVLKPELAVQSSEMKPDAAAAA